MLQEGSLQTESRLRMTARRVAGMMAAWLLIGAAVGVGNGVVVGGMSRVILPYMIAGMILFPLIGLPLGLIGGRAKESLIGAVAGALLGLALGAVAGQKATLETATHALIVGALVGATLRPYAVFTGRVFATLYAAAGYTLRFAGRLAGHTAESRT